MWEPYHLKKTEVKWNNFRYVAMVFWLRYNILNPYNCQNTNKAIFGFLKTVKGLQKSFWEITNTWKFCSNTILWQNGYSLIIIIIKVTSIFGIFAVILP
jgi:hypothetical protein